MDLKEIACGDVGQDRAPMVACANMVMNIRPDNLWTRQTTRFSMRTLIPGVSLFITMVNCKLNMSEVTYGYLKSVNRWQERFHIHVALQRSGFNSMYLFYNMKNFRVFCI
jgi:hypothetical protein